MKHLVRFFLSLSYADEHLLGWDPTMRIFRAPVTNEIQYIITMRTPAANDPTRFRSEYCITKEIISDFGPTCLRGRGTRVWKVVRCTKAGQLFGPNSEVKILKDCWVDNDSDREGDIVSCVLGDAKKLGKYDEMKAFLLTVKCHGDVHVDEDTMDETPPRDPLDIPPKDQWFNLAYMTDDPVYDFVEYNPTLHHSKVHYRIVFEEACVGLHEISLLDHVLSVLKGACDGTPLILAFSTSVFTSRLALRVLHAVGWLHCDISIGNILIKSSGSVVLADLEYAKRFDDPSLHKVRTVSTVIYVLFIHNKFC